MQNKTSKMVMHTKAMSSNADKMLTNALQLNCKLLMLMNWLFICPDTSTDFTEICLI